MERKVLEDLGLEKKDIDNIMKINGEDIENAKTSTKKELENDIEAEKLKAKKLEEDLGEANSKIESLKDVDPETLKRETEDWKKKAETAQTERNEIEKEYKAKDLLRKANVVDDLSLKALTDEFKEKNLKYENGNFEGAEGIIKELQEKYPNHFKKEKQEEVPPIEDKRDSGFNLGGMQNPKPKTEAEEIREEILGK